MNKIKTLAILIASALPALAGTTPLPSNFASGTTDYISFNNSNPFPISNMICFSDGCGGAFQATVYGPGATSATGAGVLTSVWCVDYQLEVTYGSEYVANITTLNDINSTTESNVRYGTLDSSTSAPGWVNPVSDTSGIDGGDANSSAYRYTLAAALVSQYVDSSNAVSPTNPDGGSSVNKAIQEAIWYITYNNEYPADGTTWPPETDITSSDACTTTGETNVTNPVNYMCWVKYAEANAANVNTGAWAVVSGQTNSQGVLQAPGPLNGVYGQYPSYQTFLVQVTPGGPIGQQSPTPEPTYFVLTLGLGGLIVFARRRGIRQQA
jgi:hypothetical protein